jgi:hypothetical protein
MSAPTTSSSLGEYTGYPGTGGERFPYSGQLTSSMPSGFNRDANGAKIGKPDVLDAYDVRFKEAQMMLGPPPKLTPNDPRGEVPREIDFLPAIWENQRLDKVSEEIVLFRDTKLLAILERVAPIRLFKGNPVFKHKQIIFNQARPDTYTHTGVPRMVYHSFKEWDTAIDRRGLGLEMEAEYFGTPEGSRTFQLSVQQIQIGIMQSAAVDVINALLRAPPIPRNFYEAQRTPMPYDALRQAMKPELDEWGALVKSPYGLMDVYTNVKKRIANAGGKTPNMCILPEWFKDYVRTHCPALTSFSERGERGPTAFDNNSVLSVQLGGLEVVESPVIRGDDPLERPEEPLEHPRTIGEHWYNTGDQLEHVAWDNAKVEKYIAARKFTIHDNDTDGWKEISLADVAKHLRATNLAAGFWPANGEDFCKAVDNKTLVDLRKLTVILVRPFMTYAMASAIFLPGGGAAVHTRVGYGDFRLGFDAARKKILGHYTTYMGAVVTDPNSVYVAYNIAPVEYSGGGGSTLGEDVFAIIAKTDDLCVKKRRHCLPINGGFASGIVKVEKDEHIVYNDAEQWAKFHGFPTGDNNDNMLDVGHFSQLRVNTRTFLATGFGCTVDMNGDITKPRGQAYLGNSHWGPWVYPGVAEDRMGRGANGRIVKPINLGD